MQPLEVAILRTVLYADVFNYPLTLAELHHYLIHDHPTAVAHVEDIITQSPMLKEHIQSLDGYFFSSGRTELVELRRQREEASQRLWGQAKHYAVWIARLPFVRMVALTGALAMHNAADQEDDLDYLVITTPGRVWLTRAFCIALVKWARRKGIILCPNYILAETALTQGRQDLFIAHEVGQMVPLYGDDRYRKMREANSWIITHLPNCMGPLHQEPLIELAPLWQQSKRLLEWVFNSPIGALLEGWEHRRKLRRFAQEMKTPHHAAKLDNEQVKGHFQDHGFRVLAAYQDRLARLGLNGFERSETSAAD